jgi:hypothetical protein
VPLAEIQRAEGEVVLLILFVPEAGANEGTALMKKAQRLWRWRTALRTPKRLLNVLRHLCLQRGLSNPSESTLRQIAHDTADILWERQEGHEHVMTIGNAGSQHCGECSWWAQGLGCLKQIQEWQQWVQHCHFSSDSKASECITLVDGKLSVRVEGGQQLLTMAMDNGNFVETKLDESFRVEPKAQERPQHVQDKQEGNPLKACPFAEFKTWYCLPGVLEVVYVQVKLPLDWEALALITQDPGRGSINGNTAGEPGVQMTKYTQNPQGLPLKEQPPGTIPSIATKKVILDQGPWCDVELTMDWERYMQTEGLSQHVCCQHCDSTEKPITVVTPGRMEQ